MRLNQKPINSMTHLLKDSIRAQRTFPDPPMCRRGRSVLVLGRNPQSTSLILAPPNPIHILFVFRGLQAPPFPQTLSVPAGNRTMEHDRVGTGPGIRLLRRFGDPMGTRAGGGVGSAGRGVRGAAVEEAIGGRKVGLRRLD